MEIGRLVPTPEATRPESEPAQAEPLGGNDARSGRLEYLEGGGRGVSCLASPEVEKCVASGLQQHYGQVPLSWPTQRGNVAEIPASSN